MEYMQVNRANGRAANELRPVKLTRGVMKHAHGSCLAEFGDTRVLCAATIEEGVPGWRKGAKAGWVTAEYAMLPASTGKRCKREHANRKGRSMEIERLIGRSLRTVVNMKALGEYTVTVDCDVIQADGGTRTASITGAYVALADAVAWLHAHGKIMQSPIIDSVAAISVGVVGGVEYFDDSKGTNVGATVAALKQLEEPEEIAARRGLALNEVAPDAMLRARAAGIAEAKKARLAAQAAEKAEEAAAAEGAPTAKSA